jgi:hypothetical protein
MPSTYYAPYGWYSRPYHDKFWDIVGCIYKKLYKVDGPVVAFPGYRYESQLCDCGGLTGFGIAVSLPSESAERLVQEHPDLYAQCVCELYPDDEGCKKRGGKA